MTGSRCVIFDIGGVLELTPPTGWQRTWERRLGLPDATIERRLHDVWEAGALGTITEATVQARVATDLGLDAEQTAAFFADLWSEYVGTPNEELIAYLGTLRPHARVGILSNSFVGARERETARYHFDEMVDVLVYSHEIGIPKPDPHAYAITCDHLAAAPADCLFIDDRAENVTGARAAGLYAWRHRDNASTIARIDEHLSGSGDGARGDLREPVR